MAVVPLTVYSLLPNWPVLPLVASSLLIGAGQSMTTVGDGVSFPLTGKEVIVCKGGAAAHVLTIASRLDPFNRLGDITYNVAIGVYTCFPQIQPQGYAASTGLCTITSDAGGTDVLFWCLRLQG
jgi:hypothetical protein